MWRNGCFWLLCHFQSSFLVVGFVSRLGAIYLVVMLFHEWNPAQFSLHQDKVPRGFELIERLYSIYYCIFSCPFWFDERWPSSFRWTGRWYFIRAVDPPALPRSSSCELCPKFLMGWRLLNQVLQYKLGARNEPSGYVGSEVHSLLLEDLEFEHS